MTTDSKTAQLRNGASRQGVLALDLGTSAVKSMVVVGGRVLGTGSAPLEVSSPQAGWSEQHPLDWCIAAVEAIRAAIGASGVDGGSIAGIGLSGQMHGAVVLDAQANPLRPAILWNDNRSIEECAALADAVPDIGQLAGIVPFPGFTAPKLIWMRRHEPRLFAKIRNIVSPKDYLALWLSGEISTDRSDAAGTLWLDQEARKWSTRLIDATGIDASWLPELKDGFEAAGALRRDVAATLGLLAGTPVFAGAGDAAAGAIALGVATRGRSMISLGTSAQFLVADATYTPDPEKFVHRFCHTLPETWYRMAAMLNGARPLAWFAQMIGSSVEEVLAQSQLAQSQRVPLFLPYLSGERSPHGDPAIRGCFYGLEDTTGAPEMARAVVEALAFSMADARESLGLDENTSAPIPVIGGGSRSDVVLQAVADAIGVPVARAEAGHGGAALGAALLAEVGLGQRTLAELAAAPKLGSSFEPCSAPEMTERFPKYQSLYRALRPFAAET